MKRFKTNKGFTLVEVMVLMLLFSIMLAASMPLVSKRHTELKKVAHGMYVCSNNNNGTYTEQLYKNDAKVSEKTDATSCIFTPPPKAEYFMIQIVGAGGGGGYAGTVNSPSSSSSGGTSIDVKEPAAGLAANPWLSAGTYESNTGNVSISVSSARGGSGGGISGTCNSAPLSCSGASGTPWTGGASGSAKIKAYSMGWTQVSEIDGSNGSDITNWSGTGSPTSGHAGKTGSATAYGVTYGSVSTLPGGNAASVASCVCGTSGDSSNTNSVSGSSYPASISPTSFSTSDNYMTYTWKYGLGGVGGDFDAKFYPSFKGSLNLKPGAGGLGGPATQTCAADDFPNPSAHVPVLYQGCKGLLTAVETAEVTPSTLMKVGGGIGGLGNSSVSGGRISTSMSAGAPGTLSYSGGTWTYIGPDGAKSNSSSIQLAGGFMSDYKLNQVGEKGKGGKGGGTAGTCSSDGTYPYHQFNGSSTYTSHYSDSCATFSSTGVAASSQGTGGAVFIYW